MHDLIQKFENDWNDNYLCPRELIKMWDWMLHREFNPKLLMVSDEQTATMEMAVF